ncbi:site-2 protease family protein [Burkholderia sp. MBR-1]|uniref:site-2 protease family protein n=1 Tax=Burkholderia sp. MBR-1 TaxID=2732364 RepID=UPI0015EF1FB9|nr:site-2 protease family protein [Burkholderia sp. MBR-1]QMI49888.1 hypothetical protein MBR110_30995 [Burkholderia sp. MBR-1]
MTKRQIFCSSVALVILFAEACIVDRLDIYPWWKSARLALVLYVTLYAEALIHEGGHAFVGMRLGVPIVRLRLGSCIPIYRFANPRISRKRIVLCILPLGGRVDFAYLPIFRQERIWMYAAGIVAVMIAAVIAWNVIPPTFFELRIATCTVFLASSVCNAIISMPKETVEKGVFTDGQAIRGLSRYR